jgi:phosphoribosyl 1,2-cyclic phosphodiesterase
VRLDADGEPPIIFDLGTGLRELGLRAPSEELFRATVLVSHIHWDHVQGLPFFPPIHREDTILDIYGPDQVEGPLGEVFGGFMRPPYFPVEYTQLRGEIGFYGLGWDDFSVGSAKVRARPVPHCGPTVGYRVDWDGGSVAYVSDHQQPLDSRAVSDSVLELCDGVDLLIHDAQYSPAEFAQRSDWGHCTVEFAVHVAKEAGARKLALFHHDPSHSDDELDRMLEMARCLGSYAGIEVLAASEGLSLQVGRH